jgi:hypothetical protein
MFKKQQETMGRASAAGKVSMGLKLFEVRNHKTAEAKKAETPKPAKVEMVESKSKKTAFKGIAPNAFMKKGNHWTMMRSGKIDHTIIRPTQNKSATEEIATAIGARAPAKAPSAGGPTPSVLGASKPTPLARTVATTAAAAPVSKRSSLVQTMRKSLKAMSVRSGASEEEEEKRSDDDVKPTEMGCEVGMATTVKPEQATIKSIVKADQATIKSSAGKPAEEQMEDEDDQSELDVSSVKGDANDSDDDNEDEEDKQKKKNKSDNDSDRENK